MPVLYVYHGPRSEWKFRVRWPVPVVALPLLFVLVVLFCCFCRYNCRSLCFLVVLLVRLPFFSVGVVCVLVAHLCKMWCGWHQVLGTLVGPKQVKVGWLVVCCSSLRKLEVVKLMLISSLPRLPDWLKYKVAVHIPRSENRRLQSF